MEKKEIKIDLIKADASMKRGVSAYIYIDKNYDCSIEIIIVPDLKKVFTTPDFFSSLVELRNWLYDWKGYYPLLNGSLRNVYPSRMSRQMSNGVQAYFLTMGKQAHEEDLINIFGKVEESNIDRLSTVEEQQDHYTKWLDSL